MSQTTFRPATRTDISNLLPLWHEQQAYHFHLDPEYYPRPSPELRARVEEYVKNVFTKPNSHMFVGEQNGQLTAYAVVEIEEDSSVDATEPKYGYLDELYVGAEFRQQGIGKQFMAFIEAYCRQQNLPYLKVHSAVQNDAANSYYRAMGFELKTYAFVKKLR